MKSLHSRAHAGNLCFFTVAAAFTLPPVHAEPIDDSGTIVRSPVLLMRWPAVTANRANGTQMSGSTPVQVRLNVAPWLRRSGRIYLVLPTQPPTVIHAVWTSQGRLLPGQVVSGQKALVYAGQITSPVLEDVLQLTLTVDGRQLQQGYRLDFRFEMETS